MKTYYCCHKKRDWTVASNWHECEADSIFAVAQVYYNEIKPELGPSQEIEFIFVAEVGQNIHLEGPLVFTIRDGVCIYEGPMPTDEERRRDDPRRWY